MREISYGFVFEAVCSSWRICLLLVKFLVVCVFRKSFQNEGLEYGCLSGAAIAEFSEPLLQVVLMYA